MGQRGISPFCFRLSICRLYRARAAFHSSVNSAVQPQRMKVSYRETKGSLRWAHCWSAQQTMPHTETYFCLSSTSLSPSKQVLTLRHKQVHSFSRDKKPRHELVCSLQKIETKSRQRSSSMIDKHGEATEHQMA